MRRPHVSKKMLIVLVAAVLVLAVVPAAYGSRTLSKVFPDTVNHWFKTQIGIVSDAGLMNGRTDGLFHPQDNITRGETAAVFARNLDLTEKKIEESATFTPAHMPRGCTACHVAIPGGDGRYSLAWEAKTAYAGHPFEATADIPYSGCMACHRSTANGKAVGVGVNHSLRDIVHPVHMNSGIFTSEFNGNCFTCHNVKYDGTFQVLPVSIEASTTAKGIPTDPPIASAVDPQDPPAAP